MALLSVCEGIGSCIPVRPGPLGVSTAPERTARFVKSVYDLLRVLTEGAFPASQEGIGFSTAEKLEYLAAIDKAEALGVFGNAAQRLEEDR